MGKFILLFGLFFQVFALVFLWFPKDSDFNYYFFVVTPITYLIFDYENKKERQLLILTNILAATLLLFSELVNGFSYIYLSKSMSMIFSGLSGIATISSIAIVYYLYAKDLSSTHNKLRKLANTDSLTGIANRRVSDSYIFARYGGEEFALAITNNNKALDFAKSLCHDIQNKLFLIDDNTSINITISIGIANYNNTYNSFDDLVKSADLALYKAKANGRNQVISI